MRRFILLAIAIVVLVLGYAVKTAMFPSSTPASLLTAATLSPHEIHLNYKGIKDLPVHDSTNAN